MSGLAVIMQRDGTPADCGALSRVLDRLEHRGPDGKDVYLAGSLGMGHQHFWTTPEEVGERQPLALPGLPFTIVLDGRLDNRRELLAGLGSGTPLEQSDAALMLLAYDRWAEHCVERFVGPFALVIWDEPRQRLFCARDALGDRPLYYWHNRDLLVIASEPWAILGHPAVRPVLDEIALACYFASLIPEDGRSLFQGVRELLPAHCMVVSATGGWAWRYWQAKPQPWRGRSDGEYAEAFRVLLQESVRCRLRAVDSGQVGVMMSGGLDSTSVAALAAKMIGPQPLTAISYVFDELTDCDERSYINAVVSMAGLRSLQIFGDGAWSLRNWEKWAWNPNTPISNPYRLLMEETYQAAQDAGLRVLLTGHFSDSLYIGAEDWLGDLLVEGRWAEAAREVAHHVSELGLRQTLASSFIRRLGRRVLDRLPGGRWLRRRLESASHPAWTPFTLRCLGKVLSAPDLPINALHPGQQEAILGLWEARGYSGETFYTSRFNLERRYPYRDRRLVEFVLNLPAHQFYRRGQHKYLLRNAMKGQLPEAILQRPGPTSFVSLYHRGLEREERIIRACLEDTQALWRRFVRAEWLLPNWAALIRDELESSGADPLLPWFCVASQIWFWKYGQTFIPMERVEDTL